MCVKREEYNMNVTLQLEWQFEEGTFIHLYEYILLNGAETNFIILIGKMTQNAWE